MILIAFSYECRGEEAGGEAPEIFRSQAFPIWMVAHPVSDCTQPSLLSAKLVELAGPLGHLGIHWPVRSGVTE